MTVSAKGDLYCKPCILMQDDVQWKERQCTGFDLYNNCYLGLAGFLGRLRICITSYFQ